MAILIKLLRDNALWLYGASALMALFLLWKALSARRERLQATFSLEREAASARERRIMMIAVLLLLFVCGIYALNRYVVPNVEIPYPTPEASPSPIFLPTITPTPAPVTPTATLTPILPATSEAATPTPQAATPTPQPQPIVQPAACPNAGVSISSPGMNASVSGVVTVIGTAAIEGFQFYKLEFGAGANPSDWSFLLSNNTSIQGGALGQWNVGVLGPGSYSIRLVVVDQTGNFPEPCKVTVQVTG